MFSVSKNVSLRPDWLILSNHQTFLNRLNCLGPHFDFKTNSRANESHKHTYILTGHLSLSFWDALSPCLAICWILPQKPSNKIRSHRTSELDWNILWYRQFKTNISSAWVSMTFRLISLLVLICHSCMSRRSLFSPLFIDFESPKGQDHVFYTSISPKHLIKYLKYISCAILAEMH